MPAIRTRTGKQPAKGSRHSQRIADRRANGDAVSKSSSSARPIAAQLINSFTASTSSLSLRSVKSINLTLSGPQLSAELLTPEVLAQITELYPCLDPALSVEFDSAGSCRVPGLGCTDHAIVHVSSLSHSDWVHQNISGGPQNQHQACLVAHFWGRKMENGTVQECECYPLRRLILLPKTFLQLAIWPGGSL